MIGSLGVVMNNNNQQLASNSSAPIIDMSDPVMQLAGIIYIAALIIFVWALTQVNRRQE